MELSTTAKNTILKAIHNDFIVWVLTGVAVNDSEKYNFESNSQHAMDFIEFRVGCQRQRKIQFWKQFTTSLTFIDNVYGCQRQRKIQFWKQFTTFFPTVKTLSELSTTAKNTILKAIHNTNIKIIKKWFAVNDSEKYNFESNSQRNLITHSSHLSCQRQRKIQFWKQFTTAFTPEYFFFRCQRQRKIQFWKQFTTISNTSS